MRRIGLQNIAKALQLASIGPSASPAPQQLVSLAEFAPQRMRQKYACGGMADAFATLVRAPELALSGSNTSQLADALLRTAQTPTCSAAMGATAHGIQYRALSLSTASQASRQPLAGLSAAAACRAAAAQQGFRGPPSSNCGGRGYATRAQLRRPATGGWRNSPTEQALYLVAFTVGMVGVTYAAVPLYRMFCQATGYGGTVVEGKTVEDKIRARAENPDAATEAAAAQRELTVTFNADVNDGMPWRFQPSQSYVKVRPGQSTLAFYTAENASDKVITGVSTYNVAPMQAGAYFNKIQCFCFEEQKLRPGEKIDMPVFFYVDPEFATDPRMKRVNHLTLSYTFFKVSEEAPEDVPYTGPAVANLCEPEPMPAVAT